MASWMPLKKRPTDWRPSASDSGHRKGEDGGEDDQRQHLVLGRGGNRIGRNQAPQPILDSRHGGRGGRTVDGRQSGAQRFRPSLPAAGRLPAAAAWPASRRRPRRSGRSRTRSSISPRCALPVPGRRPIRRPVTSREMISGMTVIFNASSHRPPTVEATVISGSRMRRPPDWTGRRAAARATRAPRTSQVARLLSAVIAACGI